MTLSETLVALAGVGLLILVISLGMDGIRTELKRRQCIELLQSLDRALAAYQQSTGGWPSGEAAESAPMPAGEDAVAGGASGKRVLVQLAGVAASRTVLASLPSILRSGATPGVQREPAAWASLADPWGRSLICLTASSPLPVQRKAVAANQGCPIFISAGPDGRFGLNDPSTASDNIRSDEVTD